METLKYFFTYENKLPSNLGFTLFGITHLLWIIITLLIIVLLVLIYRTLQEKNKKIMLFIIAFIMILCELSRNVWYIYIGEYSLDKALPLQLSRIILFIEAIAIFTNKRYLKEFSYACGLFSLTAFIAPNINAYPILHYNFLRYTIVHLLIIAVPIMWIIGDGFKPDYKYLPKCIILLFSIAFAALIANFVFDSNYLYINYIPEHVNININQPWYALALLGAVIGFWFITYIPWILYDRYKKVKSN
ncbi:MAG: TIGR02206 family membrane protein [Clostridiales bacterium]|nr:TIGR02206 family membrane protein [Clostridiales bacterium]